MRTRRQEIQRFAVFALLPLSIFILVLVVPFGRGVYFTFTDWNGFDITKFVGFDNYIAAFQNDDFWQSMGLTLAYVAASLVLVNLVGFVLALLVTMPLRGVNGSPKYPTCARTSTCESMNPRPRPCPISSSPLSLPPRATC